MFPFSAKSSTFSEPKCRRILGNGISSRILPNRHLGPLLSLGGNKAYFCPKLLCVRGTATHSFTLGLFSSPPLTGRCPGCESSSAQWTQELTQLLFHSKRKVFPPRTHDVSKMLEFVRIFYKGTNMTSTRRNSLLTFLLSVPQSS